MATIITPRPPLNLFEVVRKSLTSSWQNLYEVPFYEVPASGPNPARTIDAAAIITNLIVANQSATTINASVRIVDALNNTFLVANEIPVFANDFATYSLERYVLKSGEAIQIQLKADQTGFAHMSFVLNQREEFTEIAP